tara:strand:- start:78 stop:215 length:138 start_codon:yes stop_codon:yes gene_type:complete
MKKRNFIAKSLMSNKFKNKIVKPKKGKGSFKRKNLNMKKMKSLTS